MKAFELPTVTECTLTHVNLRKEFHGEEKVQAIDLSFQKEGGNELLDLIDPALRQMHYCNRAAIAGQVELDPALAILPDLRAPKLNGQKFKYGGNDKYKGYLFTQDFGLGEEAGSNIDFSNAAVGKFEYETREGGTVNIKWQVSYAGDALTDDAMTRLVRQEGETVFIQLAAPAVLQLVKGGKSKAPDTDGQESLDGEGDGEEGGADERSAEDIFAEDSIAAGG